MKILIGFFSMALLLASQCGSEADFSIGEPFVLAPGQTYQNDKLSVANLQIIEDSRCPKGTTCVWQGQAVVSLLVDGEKLELTLQSGDPSLAVGEYAGYRFVAQQLEPYPAGEQQIAPDTYRLTLLIQQQP